MPAGTIGQVQPQSFQANTKRGYGFVIHDQLGRPACTVTFATEPEARQAHAAFEEWVGKAVEVART